MERRAMAYSSDTHYHNGSGQPVILPPQLNSAAEVPDLFYHQHQLPVHIRLHPLGHQLNLPGRGASA